MNLQQAKALFFAQYLGQKVISYNSDKGKLVMVGTNSSVIHGTNKSPEQGNSNLILLLRPVNMLTDEECKICYQLRDIEMSEGGSKDDFSYIKHGIILWCKYGNLDYLNYQYLLRLGILLPFTYLDDNSKPITLQPDEIIGLKWAQHYTKK